MSVIRGCKIYNTEQAIQDRGLSYIILAYFLILIARISTKVFMYSAPLNQIVTLSSKNKYLYTISQQPNGSASISLENDKIY